MRSYEERETFANVSISENSLQITKRWNSPCFHLLLYASHILLLLLHILSFAIIRFSPLDIYVGLILIYFSVISPCIVSHHHLLLLNAHSKYIWHACELDFHVLFSWMYHCALYDQHYLILYTSKGWSQHARHMQ